MLRFTENAFRWASDSSDEEDVIVCSRTKKQVVYKKRVNYFEDLEDPEFLRRFRLTKTAVKMVLGQIIEKIKPRIERSNIRNAMEKLLLTLRNMLITVADFIGVSVSAASIIVREVSINIAMLSPKYIQMPRTRDEIIATKSAFFKMAKFPKVIGAIDCTHVRIQSPGGMNAENYRNRKGYFSLNVQAVCNDNLEFVDVVSRWPGSAHDSNIFRNSSIRAKMESGAYDDCLLLGDGGYAVGPYMMTPLSNPQTEAEKLYNESQIRTRNVIERCFGALKRRFPVLSLGMRINIDSVMAVIVACCILHNIARQHNEVELWLDDLESENEVEINQEDRPNTVRSTLIRDYFSRL